MLADRFLRQVVTSTVGVTVTLQVTAREGASGGWHERLPLKCVVNFLGLREREARDADLSC